MNRSFVVCVFFVMLSLIIASCTEAQPTIDVETQVQATLTAIARLDDSSDTPETAAGAGTETPNTPSPTLPPTATSIPPTHTSTPTPDSRLFSDYFENGIGAQWNASGEGYLVVNGKLTMDAGTFESGIIGDDSWDNYRIRFGGLSLLDVGGSKLRVMTHIQDRDNYMLLECGPGHGLNCGWFKMVGGQTTNIPETSFGRFAFPDSSVEIVLEVEGNIYRTFFNGERISYFVDETFVSGGCQVQIKNFVRLDEFEIFPLH